MIKNINTNWQGQTWRDAIKHYHSVTEIALDPDLASSVETLQNEGYVEFTPAPLDPPQPSVPFSITMRQCRRYLMSIDSTYALYDGVLAHITALPRIDREDWNACPDVWRTSPTVESIRIAFGWTPEQMDTMFVEAALL